MLRRIRSLFLSRMSVIENTNPVPGADAVYYRLKIVDLNGRIITLLATDNDIDIMVKRANNNLEDC